MTTYKTSSGKVLTEHPLLPTKEQCGLMDELVAGMDLDAFAKTSKTPRDVEPTEEDGDEAMEGG